MYVKSVLAASAIPSVAIGIRARFQRSFSKFADTFIGYFYNLIQRPIQRIDGRPAKKFLRDKVGKKARIVYGSISNYFISRA